MSAGILNQLSFKKESVWGTAVVPDKSIAVKPTGGISTNNQTGYYGGSKAVLAKNKGDFLGARTHEGELEFDFYPDYISYLVASAMGGVSSALKGGESLVYDHTISEAETKPSLTIEQVTGENVRRYAGCISTGFKIASKTNEVVTFTASVKGKSQATATKISPAYLTSRPYNFKDAVFKIGGSAISEVISVEIDYKNNVEFLHSLSASNDPTYNYAKPSEISGKIECYLDSTTLAHYNSYLAGTHVALALELTGDAIGTSSNNKVILSIPVASLKASTTSLNEDYNLVSFEFEGIYDTATSKLFNVVITNLLADLS